MVISFYFKCSHLRLAGNRIPGCGVGGAIVLSPGLGVTVTCCPLGSITVGDGVGLGVGFWPLPINDPYNGTGGVIMPGVGVALGGINWHCGTVQHWGSAGSATRVHPAGTLSYFLHL